MILYLILAGYIVAIAPGRGDSTGDNDSVFDFSGKHYKFVAIAPGRGGNRRQ